MDPEKEAGVYGAAPRPRLAIVIPTLNEASALPALLDDLRPLAVQHEVVVADGGSTDGTVGLARAAGARVIATMKGRGAQLEAGAAATQSEVLCFLHADVRLPAPALRALEAVVARPMDAAWAFRLRIDAQGLGYRIIEAGAYGRSRFLRLPYGDQGLVVSRSVYDAAGGFLPLPLMEDVTLVRSISRLAPVRLLDAAVTVSARRWEREGLVLGTLRNWVLLSAWLLGVSPDRLARGYRAEAGR